VSNEIKCICCEKTLVSENKKIEKSQKHVGMIMKNIRLVFLNDDGSVMVKCKGCKSVNAVPLTFKNTGEYIEPKSSDKTEDQNHQPDLRKKT
jgi:hypothetical protein